MGTENEEVTKKDLMIAEIIGTLLFNLSTPEIRQHILYKASLLEAMGAFEKRKKDPDYDPMKDKFVADQLLGTGDIEQLAVAFIPEGSRAQLKRSYGG